MERKNSPDTIRDLKLAGGVEIIEHATPLLHSSANLSTRHFGGVACKRILFAATPFFNMNPPVGISLIL